jgi:hypothetical protein
MRKPENLSIQPNTPVTVMKPSFLKLTPTLLLHTKKNQKDLINKSLMVPELTIYLFLKKNTTVAGTN